MKTLLISMANKIKHFLLKFNLISNFSYFESFFKKLALIQNKDNQALFQFKLIKYNFIFNIFRFLVYQKYQNQLTLLNNAILFNIFSIENLPAIGNFSVVLYFINAVYFLRLIYFKNNGITSILVRQVLQDHDDSLLHNPYIYLYKSVGKILKYFAIIDENNRISPVTLVVMFAIFLKNIFQILFCLISKNKACLYFV